MALSCTLFLLYRHRRNNHSEAHPLVLFFFVCTLMCEDGVNHVSVCLPPVFSSSGLIAVVNVCRRPNACLKAVQYETAHSGVANAPPAPTSPAVLTPILAMFRAISLAAWKKHGDILNVESVTVRLPCSSSVRGSGAFELQQ